MSFFDGLGMNGSPTFGGNAGGLMSPGAGMNPQLMMLLMQMQNRGSQLGAQGMPQFAAPGGAQGGTGGAPQLPPQAQQPGQMGAHLGMPMPGVPQPGNFQQQMQQASGIPPQGMQGQQQQGAQPNILQLLMQLDPVKLRQMLAMFGGGGAGATGV